MTDEEFEILDCITDDYCGLWEVFWEVESVAGPSLGVPIIRARSESIVRDLLLKGWARLYAGLFIRGDVRECEPGETDGWLAESHWRVPEAGEIHRRVAATDSGKAAYLEEAGRRYPAYAATTRHPNSVQLR